MFTSTTDSQTNKQTKLKQKQTYLYLVIPVIDTDNG